MPRCCRKRVISCAKSDVATFTIISIPFSVSCMLIMHQKLLAGNVFLLSMSAYNKTDKIFFAYRGDKRRRQAKAINMMPLPERGAGTECLIHQLSITLN